MRSCFLSVGLCRYELQGVSPCGGKASSFARSAFVCHMMGMFVYFHIFSFLIWVNIREQKVEREREKQYVESMVADMKEDTGKIKKSIVYCTTQVAAFDSLLRNIYHTPYTDSSLKMMYYLQRRYTGNKETVAFTKRTITQLKNSGGLRLIRNKAASDSIIIYSETCETTEFQADYFVNVRLGKVNDFAIQLFDNQYLLNYDRNTIRDILRTNSKIALLNNDEKLIKEYANTINHAKATLANYIRMLKDMESRIPEVVKFLEHEYHLE